MGLPATGCAGTLVRLPDQGTALPASAARPCALIGTNLFLRVHLRHIGVRQPIDVLRILRNQLSVPIANGVLYLKLRDDTDTVQTLTLR